MGVEETGMCDRNRMLDPRDGRATRRQRLEDGSVRKRDPTSRGSPPVSTAHRPKTQTSPAMRTTICGQGWLPLLARTEQGCLSSLSEAYSRVLSSFADPLLLMLLEAKASSLKGCLESYL